MREIRTSGCVSSEGWRVQWEARPTEAKVRSLVAWIAGRRETEFLKPIDGIILGVMASHWAVTKVNAEVASKVSGPRGRACNRRVKAAWMVAPDRSGDPLWRGRSDSTMARTR
jgi:hypothetical protein